MSQLIRHLSILYKQMAGLQCICGETFKAQCDLEPVGCPFVWLLLMMSIALHVVRCCVYDSDDESDEDSESEKSTMYT